MFGYAPTVNDMSGQIIGQGMMGAAQTNAQMMSDLGNNIAGSIGAIASAYKARSDMKSSIKSGEKMLDVLGPSLGFTTEKLKEFGYNEMSDDDKAMFHSNIWGNLGALSNLRMAQGRLGVQQNQQALTAAMPKVRNIADAQAQVASGQGTVVGLPPNVNAAFIR